MLDLINDIRSQPGTLIENSDLLNHAYEEAAEWTNGGKGVVITGMATSLWAWHSGGIILDAAKVGHSIVDTSEYHRYGTADTDRSPLIVTSRSGESAEILNLLGAVEADRQIIGITGDASSTLGRRATRVLEFKAAEEAFYNTSSFTTTLCLATAIAAGIAGRRDLAVKSWLKDLSEKVGIVTEREQGAFAKAGAIIAESRIALISARGHLIGVAQQASLDLQEGPRIGAIPIPGGLLRHGPMELLSLSDSVLVILIPRDHMTDVMVRATSDILGFGA